MANGRETVTLRWGPSVLSVAMSGASLVAASISSVVEPIRNSPAGTTTISGQGIPGQPLSRKLLPDPALMRLAGSTAGEVLVVVPGLGVLA